MEYYDDETLKKIQNIELMILSDFDTFCREHKIDYFLCGGSALGAVRHGGFIPWDDDIDVFLLREDYDKFLNFAEKEMSDKYYILDYDHNKDFVLMNAHLCLKGTKFIPNDIKTLEDSGIFLDLFCLDNISDDPQKAKKQIKKAWTWNKLMILSKVKKPVLIMYFGWKKKLMEVILMIVHYMLLLVRITPEHCYKKINYYRDLYKNEDTDTVGFMFDSTPYMSVLKKSKMYPTKRMMFNGVEANVPHDVKAYLKHTYGDYMKLPPKEKQHNHVPYRLDFGPYKDCLFKGGRVIRNEKDTDCANNI